MARTAPFEIVVIGGGATGAGIALDAVSRGFSVLLLERADFGSGTSSRSSKLIHGGIRYLAQGRFGLVRQALRERAILRRNAPHLVRPMPFVIPVTNLLDLARFSAGVKLYDLLAGADGLGCSRLLTRSELAEELPNLALSRVARGVEYVDARFDDTQLLLAILRTAVSHGALVANYCPVTALVKAANGKTEGVRFTDAETGIEHAVGARIVINATGVWTDTIQRFDDEALSASITWSQGAHIVVDRSFLPGQSALVIPHTPDGRIMFAIPWYGHVLLGTTDTALTRLPDAPEALPEEIDQILALAKPYLTRAPTRADLRAVFAGVRPLLRSRPGIPTAGLSREHRIAIGRSGLVSVIGGKWTTYRRMASDALDAALLAHDLPRRSCRTERIRLIGAHDSAAAAPFAEYGAEAAQLHELIARDPELGIPLHPALPYVGAECIFAVRHEMARRVEDVLARRLRASFLDQVAARAAAPRVAALMANELGKSPSWQSSELASL